MNTCTYIRKGNFTYTVYTIKVHAAYVQKRVNKRNLQTGRLVHHINLNKANQPQDQSRLSLAGYGYRKLSKNQNLLVSKTTEMLGPYDKKEIGDGNCLYLRREK